MQEYPWLMHGNCLELMNEIPDGSVDMILCDLPYGTTACKEDNIQLLRDFIAEIDDMTAMAQPPMPLLPQAPPEAMAPSELVPNVPGVV